MLRIHEGLLHVPEPPCSAAGSLRFLTAGSNRRRKVAVADATDDGTTNGPDRLISTELAYPSTSLLRAVVEGLHGTAPTKSARPA